MATAVTAASVVEGPPARQVLPLSFVDELKQLRRGELTLEIGFGSVRAEAAGQVVEGKLLDTDFANFPDLRRLMERPEPATRVRVDVKTLRELVTGSPALTREHDGATYEVSVLAFDPQGSVRVAAESEWAADQGAHVAVNREFLLQALDAGGAGQLVLELDGPIKPLAVRVPGDESHFSILMPVRH
jgi:DNA polymerase III sliding clamp (beta) subunit (PCNA family)